MIHGKSSPEPVMTSSTAWATVGLPVGGHRPFRCGIRRERGRSRRFGAPDDAVGGRDRRPRGDRVGVDLGFGAHASLRVCGAADGDVQSRRSAQADDGQMGTPGVMPEAQLHDRALLPAESLAGTRRVPGSRFDARSVAGKSSRRPVESLGHVVTSRASRSSCTAPAAFGRSFEASSPSRSSWRRRVVEVLVRGVGIDPAVCVGQAVTSSSSTTS